MLRDPYAVLRALLRAEAARNAPKPRTKVAPRSDRETTRRLPETDTDRGR